MPSFSTRVRAFTLIELLVTVSIIGVLAAMMLPSLKGVIARSNTAKSMNNLRQIGVAVVGYANDNNGELPSKDFTDPARLWIKVVYEQIYDKPWPDFVPYDTGANLKGTVFFSPSLKSNEPKPWRSYGWNNYLQYQNASGIVNSPPRLHSIAKPAKLILCGEVMNTSTLYFNKYSLRNQGNVMMLMADFHVAVMEPSVMPATQYDPMWDPTR